MTGQKDKPCTIQIEAQALRIHPRAQRALVPSILKRIESNFHLGSIGTLHAVKYPIHGERAFWVIDGQHRWQVLLKLGYRECILPVQIHTEVDNEADSCRLFLELNNRGGVCSFDKFENARYAGFVDAVGIYAIASERQLKVDRNSRDGFLSCVSVLFNVFNFDEGKSLAAALDTLLAAWGHTASAMEGRIVEGVGLVYKHFNGTIDRAVMVKKLAKYPGGPSALLGDARGLREYKHTSVTRCVAERVIDTYNVGRQAGKLDPI